jgi:hypothetical protein
MNARIALLLAAAALWAPPVLAVENTAPAVRAPEGVQVAQAAGVRSLRNADAGFRLAHPADWTVTEPTEPFIKTVLNAPPGPNPASCFIIMHEADEYLGLNQAQLDWGMRNHTAYDEDLARGLPAYFTNVEVRDNVGTKVGNLPARMATIAATNTKTQQHTVMMMFLAHTAPARVWHLTCAATGADLRAAEAAFAARRIDFLRLFSTFYWDN